MVKDTTTDTTEDLEPDAVYFRRRAIIEAILHEHKLEEDKLDRMNAQLDTVSPHDEKALEDLQNEIQEQEYNVNELSDAVHAVMHSMSTPQIQAIKTEFNL